MNNAPLSKVFKNTATSYKFLFFKTILDILGLTGNLKEKRTTIELKQFYLFFLVNSWYPISTFKLSFGKQDMLPTFVTKLKLNSEDKRLLSHDIDYYDLDRILIHNQDSYYKEVFDTLDKYVKYRFLTPYMEERLRGVNDPQRNAKIRDLLEKDFKSAKKFPYHFKNENGVEYLIINPSFDEFISSNFVVIYDWWKWNFAEYLSKHNPLTPSILFKMESPKKRKLVYARNYWNTVISLNGGSIKCIYSGKIISKPVSLDHFLPWSFLPNDKTWNIIPTTGSINSSKSDNLPIRDYLENFIDFQIESLSLYVANLNKPSKGTLTNTVLEDEFRFKESTSLLSLLSDKSIKKTFQNTILNYYNLAEEQGFAATWKYSQAL